MRIGDRKQKQDHRSISEHQSLQESSLELCSSVGVDSKDIQYIDGFPTVENDVQIIGECKRKKVLILRLTPVNRLVILRSFDDVLQWLQCVVAQNSNKKFVIESAKDIAGENVYDVMVLPSKSLFDRFQSLYAAIDNVTVEIATCVTNAINEVEGAIEREFGYRQQNNDNSNDEKEKPVEKASRSHSKSKKRGKKSKEKRREKKRECNDDLMNENSQEQAKEEPKKEEQKEEVKVEEKRIDTSEEKKKVESKPEEKKPEEIKQTSAVEKNSQEESTRHTIRRGTSSSQKVASMPEKKINPLPQVPTSSNPLVMQALEMGFKCIPVPELESLLRRHKKIENCIEELIKLNEKYEK